MYEFCFGRSKICVSFSFLALISLMTALDTGIRSMLLVCIGCCVFHECGHLCAMLLFGSRPESIILYGGGILIKRRKGMIFSNFQDMIIYLSGPCANFILAFICYLFDHTEICHYSLFCAVFNLLPFSYFDGGRALEALIPFSKLIVVIRAFFILVLALLCSVVFIDNGVNISLLVTFLYIAVCELIT